jgi:cobalamin biosynthesis protein CobT
METATSNYNAEFYLDQHLRNIARKIESRPGMEAGAIGIALDMDDYFSNCINLDLTGTLGIRSFMALEQLFHRPGARFH